MTTWDHSIYPWRTLSVYWGGEQVTLLAKWRISTEYHRLLLTDTRRIWQESADLSIVTARARVCGGDVTDDLDDLEFLGDTIEAALQGQHKEIRFRVDGEAQLDMQIDSNRGPLEWTFQLFEIPTEEATSILSKEVTLPLATLSLGYREHIDKLVAIATAKQKEVSELLILLSRAQVSPTSRSRATQDFNASQFMRSMNEEIGGDYVASSTKLYNLLSPKDTMDLMHSAARNSRLPQLVSASSNRPSAAIATVKAARRSPIPTQLMDTVPIDTPLQPMDTAPLYTPVIDDTLPPSKTPSSPADPAASLSKDYDSDATDVSGDERPPPTSSLKVASPASTPMRLAESSPAPSVTINRNQELTEHEAELERRAELTRQLDEEKIRKAKKRRKMF